MLGSLQTSLLYIEGKLAGGGFVAVAVGVSDRWQVTGDRWRATHETWHITCDMWHMTWYTWHMSYDTCHMRFFLYFFLSVSFCLFWYRCYYPQMSRDLVSCVCGIFFWYLRTATPPLLSFYNHWRGNKQFWTPIKNPSFDCNMLHPAPLTTLKQDDNRHYPAIGDPLTTLK